MSEDFLLNTAPDLSARLTDEKVATRKEPRRPRTDKHQRAGLCATTLDEPRIQAHQLATASTWSSGATIAPQDPLIVRRREMRALSGLPNSTMYDKLDPKSPRHDPTFPKPIKLGVRAIGFWRHEVVEWLKSRGRSGEQ